MAAERMRQYRERKKEEKKRKQLRYDAMIANFDPPKTGCRRLTQYSANSLTIIYLYNSPHLHFITILESAPMQGR